MTILAPLTPLSGSSETSCTASTNAALRGAAESSSVAMGDIRVTTGGVTYVSLGDATAETSSDASGDIHALKWLSGSAETGTEARKAQGIKAAFAFLDSKGGNKAYAESVNMFQPMTSYLREALPTPSYAVVLGEFFPMLSSGRMLTGTLGQSAASFLPMRTKVSKNPYAQVNASFAFMTAKAIEGPPLTQLMWYEFCKLSSLVTTNMTQTQTHDELLKLSETYAAESVVVAYISELLKVATTVTDKATYTAIINEALRLISSVGKQDVYSAWALNLTNNASTSYTNFEFNSMTTWQNKYIAASADGLYLLEGDTDNGVAIDAALTLGTTDYGTANKKTITYVYIGAESAGDIKLGVIPDDGELYTYTVPQSTTLGTRRTTVGKGIRSRYWQLTLTNTAGADVKFDTVNVDVAELTRRI